MRRAIALALISLAVSSVSLAATVEKVVAFPKADSVRVVATVKDVRAGEVVSGEIVPVGGGAAVWRGQLAKADGAGRSETVIKGVKAEVWSPGAPRLYVLKVRAGGEETAVRFGFRSVESKDGHVMLNGRPIFLRGIAINPPGRDVPEAVGFSREFAYGYVKFLRSQNVNLIRMNFPLEPDPRQQVWFDACDELGMMVYQGSYGAPPSGVKGKRGGGGGAVDPEEQNDVFTGAVPGAKKPAGGNAAAPGGAIGNDPPFAPDLDAVEGGKTAPPKDFGASMAAYKETFEHYARHPSVVIYILSNELPYTGTRGKAWHEFLTKAHEHLRKWDDSRLFIGNAGYGEGKEGDINDVHRYWGWYYNTVLTYYNLRTFEKLYGEKGKVQPFTFSECVGNFTGPMGEYNLTFRKQLAPQLGWTGHGENQRELALAHQAYTVQHACESFRTMRATNEKLSGLMPFTIQFFHWEGIKSFDEMGAKPSMLQMGAAYQPVLLSWENWTPNVYAGGKIRPIAHVVNDAEDFSDLTGATLAWELVDQGGKAVVSGKVEVPAVKYYGTRQLKTEVAVPEGTATGEYTLRGEVTRGGKVVSKNAKPVFVAGKEWVGGLRWAGAAAAVYDPSGKTVKALEGLGVPVEGVRDLAKVGKGRVVVVGEMAASGAIPGAKEFVAGGGRILCLGQDHAKVDVGFVPAKVKFFTTSANDPAYLDKLRPTYDQMNVNPERPWHPALAGIDRARLRTWGDYTGWDESKPGFPAVYPVKYGFKLENDADLKRTAILANYDRGLEGIALAEVFAESGGGAVVMCGFDLVPRIGRDPVADKVMLNLVKYMGAAEREVHPLVTEPIRWGRYETERGVNPGPLTGLVYNCVWVVPPTDPKAKPMLDNMGAWNMHPGNQFVARGIRPFGPYGWSTGAAPQQATRNKPTGEGVFYCRVPAGRDVVVSTVRNNGKEAGKLVVSVNGKAGRAEVVGAGEIVEVRTPTGGATELAVGYAGDVTMVVEETRFE